ncbi:MAG TPA: nuclease-related domain-containing protein, partial [Anaerolineae bacterium]|nr:nuclease-related domain-containing protein [Anaerolineae bacterium]
MTARYQAVGKPAHRQEIDALKFLIRGLPESHMLYANSWLAERDGALYELDAVVVAPHAVFIVEIKGYTGAIR